MEYAYSHNQILDKPNTYFYSSCQETEFLESWQAARNKISVAEKEPPVAKPGTLPTPGQPSNTKDLLETLLYSYSNLKNQIQDTRHWTNKLIKKFEVTKHLHPSYDGGFKADDKLDFRTLNLYVRFAEVLEAAYQINNQLPILNCLVKCMDVLCGMESKLTEDERGRLARLIHKERDHVMELYQKSVGSIYRQCQ